jgi:O-antigen/teichoic acid export membrane protein
MSSCITLTPAGAVASIQGVSFTRAVAYNTAIQTVGRFVSIIIGLVAVGLLTRGLGQEGYGQYTTVLSVLGFISVIADLGLYLVLVRELAAKERAEEYIVGNILGLRLAAAFVLLVAGATAAMLLDYPFVVKVGIWVGALSYFASAGVQLLTGVYQTKLMMVRVVSAEVVGRIVFFGLTWYGLAHQWDLVLLIGALAVGSIVNFGVLLLGLRGVVRVKLAYDFPYWRMIFFQTLPIAISVILNVIYFRLDTIFLSLFRSQSEVGLYGAAYKILEVLVSFPTLFIGLVLPVLSATAMNDMNRFRWVFQRAFDLLALAAFPLVVGGIILARPLIVFVSGEQFADSAGIFRLLLLAVGCLYFGALSGHAIIAIRKQRPMMKVYGSVAVIGVIVYLFLIPRFSTTGAALGTILTEALSMTAGYIIVLRTTAYRLRFAGIARAAFATAVMALALWLMRPFPWPVQLMVAVVVYLGTVLAVRGIPMRELRQILSRSAA